MRAYTTLAGAVSKFSVISVTASSPFTPISSGYVWGFLGTTSGSTKLADVAGLFSNWSGGSVSSATNY